MPFCSQCGTELEGRFCHNCGAASTHSPEAAPSQQTAKLESSGSSLVGSVEYHPGYEESAAGPATGSATEKFKLDEGSARLVRAAGF